MTTGRINQVSVHNHFPYQKRYGEQWAAEQGSENAFLVGVVSSSQIENLWFFKCLSLFPLYTLFMSNVSR